MAKPKNSKTIKIPKGTKKNPWFMVAESKPNGKVCYHYLRFTLRGIWKIDKKPEGYLIKDTEWLIRPQTRLRQEK